MYMQTQKIRYTLGRKKKKRTAILESLRSVLLHTGTNLKSYFPSNGKHANHLKCRHAGSVRKYSVRTAKRKKLFPRRKPRHRKRNFV